MLTASNHGRIARLGGTGLFLVVIHAALCAQLLHPKEPMPSFEVATVKPWELPPSSAAAIATGNIKKIVPGNTLPAVTDRVHFIGQVELLIAAAYQINVFSTGVRVLGGPDWIRQESDRYELIGKIDDSQFAAIQKMDPAQQHEQVSLMEQSLLAERFKLKVHFETKDLPRYDLVLAKGGSKLVRAEDGAVSRMSFGGTGRRCEIEVNATAVTLGDLARAPFLRRDKREVVDGTGAAGRFDFTLKFRSSNCSDSEAATGDGADAPDLFTALQEQLGLKLVPDNGPVEVLVIDHVERPTGN